MASDGVLLGIIWASLEGHAAGYMRRVEADSDNITRPTYWNERLDTQADQGIAAIDAIRTWIGVPPDGQMGGVPAAAEEGRARNQTELWDLLNPGGPPLGEGPWVQDGQFPSGTPEDRSSGWSVPVAHNPPSYAVEANGPIIFYPITKNSETVGYLWASPDEAAAGYVPRLPAGRDGRLASGLWISRLMDCYAAGRTAVDALRWCRTQPYDEYSGVIALDAKEESIDSVDTLRRLAQE